MGASVKFTQFAMRTTNGTTDITVPGAGTCKGAVFIMSGGVTDATVRNHKHFCFGWIDSAGDESIGVCGDCENAQATMDTGRHWSSVFALGANSDGGGIDAAFSHSAFIPDGIRITTSNPSTTAFLVTAMLFFGSDVTLVRGTITPSSAVDVEDTVNIGQNSDLLFWSHVDTNGATDTYQNSTANTNLAISTLSGGTIRQRGFRIGSFNSANGDIRQFTGDRLDANFSTGTSIDRAMECTTMDGNEVGITSRENAAPNDRPYRFLSVNFNGVIEARVEALTVPTSGDLSSTAYGFTPQAMLFGFINVVAQTNESGVFTGNQDDISHVGGMDGTREHCSGWSDEDGSASSNCTSVTNDKVLYATNVSDAVSVDGTFASFDANGFTVTMNTNPGSVRAGWGLAIEEEAAAVGDIAPIVATQNRNRIKAILPM